MDLEELGEFGLIGRIRQDFACPDSTGTRGIGDDCAVIPQVGGYDTLVSTDMLMEGTHFLLEDVGAYQLGWKSAAVNFSDIAAMGGCPVGSFLAFALPRNLPEGWMDAFLQGYRDISVRYGFPLLGGDTTSSRDRLCICVTVLGKAVSGTARMRSYARPGDLVCVTGTLGDSSAGLDVILNGRRGTSFADRLVERHYKPMPRMEEGRRLAGTEGVHAMMDISDGTGSDIRHIMEESGVGVEIDAARIPVSEELKAYCASHNLDMLQFAVSGGEDYELLFTASPDARIDVEHTVIGVVTDSGKLLWKGTDKDYSGYRHF